MARRHNIVSEISSDFLTCQICLETYDRPKTLTCGHFFCRDCLVDYCRSNRKQSDSSLESSDDHTRASGVWVHCPTCRKLIGAIKESADVETFIDDFPDNFYVNSLKDLVAHHSRKPSLRTKSHHGHPIAAGKIDKPQHLRSFSFTEGAVGGQPLESQIIHGPRCADHPQEVIKFYCPDHHEILCQCCLIQRHILCEKCVTVEEAESRFIRPRIQHLVTSLADHKIFFSEELKNFTLHRQRLQVNVYENQKRIDRLKKYLEDKMTKCFADINEQLNSTFDDEEAKCKFKHGEIKMKEAIIHEVHQNLESLSRKGDAFEMVSTIGAYELQVEEILSSVAVKENERLCSKKEIHFEENEALHSLLKADQNVFGNITLRYLNEQPSDTSVDIQETASLPGKAATWSDNHSDKNWQGPVKPDLRTRAESVGCWRTHSASDIITSPVPFPEGLPKSMDRDLSIRHSCSTPKAEKAFLSLEETHVHEEMLICKVEERSEFLSNRFSSVEACCVMGNGDIIVISSDEKVVLRFTRLHPGIKVEALQLPTGPLCLTLCSKKSVSLAVTAWNKKIYFVSTDPGLLVVSSISTRVQYKGISRIPKRLSLVAIAPWETSPVVDLLSLQGQVLKTFGGGVPSPIFMEPTSITTTTDFLFVADGRQFLVLSWDGQLLQTIDCFGESPEGTKQFGRLSGICLCGDHVLLADSQQGKIHAVGHDEKGWYGTVVIESEHFTKEPWSISSGRNCTVLTEGQRIHGYSIEFDNIVSGANMLKTSVEGFEISRRRVYRYQTGQPKDMLAQSSKE